MVVLIFFFENQTSVAFLLVSSLKRFFYWWTHSVILFKSDFNLFWESLSFLAIEKSDVLLTNILHNDLIHSGLWLMEIKNKMHLIVSLEIHLPIFFPRKMFIHSEQLDVVVNSSSSALNSKVFNLSHMFKYQPLISNFVKILRDV